MASNVKQIIQDLIIPEFRALQVEIRRVDEKVDSFRNEFRSEIHRLDEGISNLDKQLNARMDSLEKEMSHVREDFKRAIDLHERIALIEGKLSLSR